jgi:hypothetical protein
MIPHRVWDEVEVWDFFEKTVESFRCKVVGMMLKKASPDSLGRAYFCSGRQKSPV